MPGNHESEIVTKSVSDLVVCKPSGGERREVEHLGHPDEMDLDVL